MKKAISLSLFVIFSILAVTAQDIDMNLLNPYSNPVYLNPAFSGGSLGPAVFVNRTQMQNRPSHTSMITIDIPLDKISGGVGVAFHHRRNARFSSINIYKLSYAYSLRASENFSVRIGAQGDYIKKQLDSYIALDPELKQRVEITDVSGGLLASGKKFNAGFSVCHINQPNQNYYKRFDYPLTRKYTLHGSWTFTAGKFNVSPYMMYWQQKFSEKQIGVGCYFSMGIFSLSGALREDLSVFSAGLKHKHFKLGYSHDLTIAKLGKQAVASHEIYLIGMLPSKKERIKLQPANLPIF